jgi:nucleotide-binding universal stress UspA family protein
MTFENKTSQDNSDGISSHDLNEENKKDNLSLNSHAISKNNFPSFGKILVTYDGKVKSDKAINYSIYLSNISGAQIIILQVVENIDKLENTSVDVSNENNVNRSTTATTNNSMESENKNYSVNMEGQIIDSMEEKIKMIENTGFKNKVSYKMRTGSAVGEIINEIDESKYDLLILSSSHFDSWMKSLFSDTRKIIGNINIPVLLLQE